MKQKIMKSAGILVGLLFLYLVGRFGFTITKIADVEKTVQDEAFDQVAYVDGIWESKILPTFKESSVELSEILSQVQLDDDGTASKDSLAELVNKYGHITEGEAHVYMVKGTGVISAVNTETSQGTAEVVLNNYDGNIKVHLYIGNRIPSDDTSVRDAVEFIKFGDFKEQTEYGKVASELNKRVIKTLGTLNKDELIGKTVSFNGGFTIRTFNLITINLEEIYIVPVEIELGE